MPSNENTPGTSEDAEQFSFDDDRFGNAFDGSDKDGELVSDQSGAGRSIDFNATKERANKKVLARAQKSGSKEGSSGLDPNKLATLRKLDDCPEYYRLSFEDVWKDILGEGSGRWREVLLQLNIALAKDGEDYERTACAEIQALDGVQFFDEVEDEMESIAESPTEGTFDDRQHLDKYDAGAEYIVSKLVECASQPAWDDGGDIFVLEQVPLSADINDAPVAGIADLVVFWPVGDGEVEARFLDVKASFDESSYHRFQIATYTALFRDLLRSIDGKEETWSNRVTISGGVYHRDGVLVGPPGNREYVRDAAITGRSPDEFPEFDLAPVEMDFYRFMRSSGKVGKLRDTANSVEPLNPGEEEDKETVPDGGEERINNRDTADFQLNDKCFGCTYREVCYDYAISNASLKMLGLSADEQVAFREAGIHTVHDLANIGTIELAEKRHPAFTYGEVKIEADEQYEALLNHDSVGTRLTQLVQRAQRFSERLYHKEDDEGYVNAEPLVASGAADVPPYNVTQKEDGVDEDEEPVAPEEEATEQADDDPDFDTDPRRLVRSYIHVQYDHRRDRVAMLSAFTTSHNAVKENGASPERCSSLVGDIGDDVTEDTRHEREMVEDFARKLLTNIRTVAKKGGDEATAPLHFYVYTSPQQEALVEALERHSDLEPVQALLELMMLREPMQRGLTMWRHPRADTHEQPMLSVIEPEVEDHVALTTPNDSLLAVVDDVPCTSSANIYREGAPYVRTDSNGEEIRLRDVFNFLLFDYRLPVKPDPRPGEPTRTNADDPEAEQFYPVLPRSGASIPLEYVWAVAGDLNEEWVEVWDIDEDDEDENMTVAEAVNNGIRPFMYRDSEADGELERITLEDLTSLGEWMAQAVGHVADYLIADREMVKPAFDMQHLDTYTMGETNLARATREFLDMEAAAEQASNYAHYQKPIRERIRSGESAYFKIVSVDEQNDRMFGKLLQDGDRPMPNEEVSNSCTIETEDSSEWMGITPITAPDGKTFKYVYRDGYMLNRQPARHVELAPTVKVTDIDLLGDGDPRWDIGEDYDIVVEFPEMRQSGYDWTFNPAKGSSEDSFSTHLFDEGTGVVLDPRYNPSNEQKLRNLLDVDDGRRHPLVSTLQELINGVDAPPTTDHFDAGVVESFLDSPAFGRDAPLDPPNGKQREFVTTVADQFSLLQGPPGTGKTSGALMPAILSRVASKHEDGGNCRGFIGATSNAAIDEVMEKVAEGAVALHDAPGDAFDVQNLRLIRIVSKGYDPEADNNTNLSRVEYVEATANDLGHVLSTLRHGGSHTLVFGTAYRMNKLLNEGRKERSLDTMSEFVNTQPSWFNLIALDEASMLRLPELCAFGAGASPDAQYLLAGDHRQMPPVLKHEWDDERRRTLTEIAPYLSTLDFFRLLNGEDDVVDRDQYPSQLAPSAAEREPFGLSVTRLEQTYRCHSCIAGFLREQHYDRLDGINYRRADGIPEPALGRVTPRNDAAAAAVSKERPLTVIVHGEDSSRKSNPVEADISNELVQALNIDYSNEDGSNLEPGDVAEDLNGVGIVTPHRSQRGKLKRTLRSTVYGEGRGAKTAAECITVDTVERFQGQENDAMIVSGTASDPQFLANEEDFILSPNRLNVAMSRAKAKLIVVVSEEVFDLMPGEIDSYEDARLWKALYGELGMLDSEPDWSGSLGEFVNGSPDGPADTSIEVFSLSATHYDT